MKKLKWCAYSLTGLTMLVILITVLGQLASGKQFIYNLQQMDRADALEIVMGIYYKRYYSSGISGVSEEGIRAMANTYLDENISELTLLEKVILGVKPSKVFNISSRIVILSCIVSLIWLELWRAKLEDATATD